MTIRTSAPPIRIPMLLDKPSLICLLNAGEPEISTFTPAGAPVVSTTESTLASTVFWTFSDNPGVSEIWTRVSTLEGAILLRVASGKGADDPVRIRPGCGKCPAVIGLQHVNNRERALDILLLPDLFFQIFDICPGLLHLTGQQSR